MPSLPPGHLNPLARASAGVEVAVLGGAAVAAASAGSFLVALPAVVPQPVRPESRAHTHVPT